MLAPFFQQILCCSSHVDAFIEREDFQRVSKYGKRGRDRSMEWITVEVEFC